MVVWIASGCSEEAEPGVRNSAKTERVPPPHLSDDCERDSDGRPESLKCFTVSEQQRAASLMNSVMYLVHHDEELEFNHYENTTNLLKLLIDFEALEVLCYTSLYRTMEDRELWPFGEHFGPLSVTPHPKLRGALYMIGMRIDVLFSKVTARPFIDPLDGKLPVLEPIRYRHLCPDWINEPLP